MTAWLPQWIEQAGYLAVAALMFAENLFPPIPSELIMPLSGYVASQGRLNVAGVLAAGWAGSMLGALFWYGVGLWVGSARIKRFAARHGAWLTMTPEDVERANRWFCRWGGWAVLLGRLMPAVRTLISVPAGISDMTFRKFFLFTAIGTGIWTSLLAAGGYLMGERYDAISGWIGPASNAVLALLAVWYLWRVATFKRRRHTSPGRQ
jgi:membrane protein DedA with SNARE-associated domain